MLVAPFAGPTWEDAGHTEAIDTAFNAVAKSAIVAEKCFRTGTASLFALVAPQTGRTRIISRRAGAQFAALHAIAEKLVIARDLVVARSANVGDFVARLIG